MEFVKNILLILQNKIIIILILLIIFLICLRNIHVQKKRIMRKIDRLSYEKQKIDKKLELIK